MYLWVVRNNFCGLFALAEWAGIHQKLDVLAKKLLDGLNLETPDLSAGAAKNGEGSCYTPEGYALRGIHRTFRDSAVAGKGVGQL